MTSTIEEKASFDQQAQFVDQKVRQEPKSENEGSISDSVVLHKILSRNSNADVVYLKVDFEKKSKKTRIEKSTKCWEKNNGLQRRKRLFCRRAYSFHL